MSIDVLAPLAAYTLRMAHEMDRLCVAGLDLAIYRNSTARFEFADSAVYWDKAAYIDQKIRGCFVQAVDDFVAAKNSKLL